MLFQKITYEENTYPRPVTIIDRLVVDTYKQALPKPTAGCVIHINIDDINIIKLLIFAGHQQPKRWCVFTGLFHAFILC